jgi:hypothetical protein
VLTLALGAAARSSAHRSLDGTADLDRVVLEADFAGALRVLEVTAPNKDGVIEIVAEVRDVWRSRWSHVTPGATLRIPLVQDEAWARVVAPEGTEIAALVSGGPWQRTALTFGAHTIWRLAEDGTLRCRSGNPLFGFRYGIQCSTQDKVASPPLTYDQLRDGFLQALAAAERRFPDRVAALSTSRPLLSRPAAYVDRTVFGQEVRR